MPSISEDQPNTVIKQPASLKICTYNIHKGFASGNRQHVLDQIRQAIRVVDADVVFLQEVVGANEKHHSVIKTVDQEVQFEYLADSVWPHYSYGKNALYDHGHHGNAILSRYPLSDCSNFDISCLPLSQRGILHAVILGGIHLFCVHIGFFQREQRYQLKKLVEIVQGRVSDGEAVIIAGDFNDWPRKANKYLKDALAVTEIFEYVNGKSVPTFPSILPMLPMDRIYFRDIEVQDAQVLSGRPWNRLSDHCALYASFYCDKQVDGK